MSNDLFRLAGWTCSRMLFNPMMSLLSVDGETYHVWVFIKESALLSDSSRRKCLVLDLTSSCHA